MTIESRPLAYRPDQVAQMLGCSVETVYKLLRESKLKGYKIGAARFVSAVELERFVRDAEANG